MSWTVRRRARGVYIWTPQVWRYVILLRLTFPPSIAFQRALTNREVGRLIGRRQ